ncbi:trigger factor [bacterium]|nr:trigger factor [bacterium]
MAVTIEQTAPCRRKLRIEVPAERVATLRTETLQQFHGAARLPGFRPGKAPVAMVERRYARDIDDEVRKRLVPEAYREAVTEQQLKVVGQPHIHEVQSEPGQPLVITVEVDTAPEFDLPEYKGIGLKQSEAVVKDEDLQRTLEALRDQQAEFTDIEGRALQTGDFAVVNYTGVAEGKPLAEIAPQAKGLGEAKNFWLLIQSDSFLPGFCDQLLGAAIGEKRQVQVDFPADFPQQPLAGKKAAFFVEVAGIKERKLPEFDDEFAKKAGAESLAKLQEDVRAGLQAEAENEVRSQLRRQLIDQLLAQTPFELPESLVTAETRGIVYDLVRENTMRGATKEQLEEKKDEIFGFAQRSARDRLRVSFILHAIARAEKIEVTPEDLEQRIAMLAQRHKAPVEKLKAQLGEKGGLDELEEQLLAGKTLDFLVANAKVEPTPAA